MPFIHIETKQEKVLFHLVLSLSCCIILRCHEAIRIFVCTLWCDTQTARVTSSTVLTLRLVTHYFEKKILKKQVNSNETNISYLFFYRIKFKHTVLAFSMYLILLLGLGVNVEDNVNPLGYCIKSLCI